MDREKIIEEWEAVLSRDPLDAPWDLIEETVEMLKEPEAVEPKIVTLPKKDHDDSHIYRCGNCDMIIFKSHKYCQFCERAVKWNG